MRVLWSHRLRGGRNLQLQRAVRFSTVSSLCATSIDLTVKQLIEADLVLAVLP